MKSEDSDWAKQFQEYLESGGAFPNWSIDDLKEVIPDEELRTHRWLPRSIHARWISSQNLFPYLKAGLTRPAFTFYSVSRIKVQQSQARESGWPTYELEAGHFHMLVDSEAVTNMIVKSENKVVD